MGLKLLSATAGGLVLMTTIDLFVWWYGRFLRRLPVDPRLGRMLGRLLWALLALLFWAALVRYGMPDQFTVSYFLFALFIYTVRGLIISFMPTRGRRSHSG